MSSAAPPERRVTPRHLGTWEQRSAVTRHSPPQPCRQWRLWWRVAQSAAAEQFLINGLCGRIRNNPAEKLHLIEKLLAGETNCLGGSQLKLSRGKYLLSAVKIFAARTIIESQDRGGSTEFLRGHGRSYCC